MTATLQLDMPTTKKQRQELRRMVPQILTKPLVGPRIMEFESSATRYSPQQVRQLSEKYTDFVIAAVKALREEGYQKPRNWGELWRLSREVGSIVWSNFQSKHTTLLISGLASAGKGILGSLDCDLSCFVFADIMNQFGVKSHLVSLPEHVILKIESNKESLYVETTLTMSLIFALTRSDLEKRYPIIYGEYRFGSQPNPILYKNRANARSDEFKDYRGTIADLSIAIKMSPKDASAYLNRGIAKTLLDDPSARSDYDMAIRLRPDDADTFIARAIQRELIGDRKGALEDRAIARRIRKDKKGK